MKGLAAAESMEHISADYISERQVLLLSYLYMSVSVPDSHTQREEVRSLVPRLPICESYIIYLFCVSVVRCRPSLKKDERTALYYKDGRMVLPEAERSDDDG